jgi:hypothetical protein
MVDGRRRFSASFYADLLHRLGVSLVLGLDGARYDPAPFARRGIRLCGPEHLLLAPDASLASEAGLQAATLGRFVELVHGAGGGVAVHADGRVGHACALAASWLGEVGLFPSAEAASAWVSLVRGASAAADMGQLQQHWAQRRMTSGPVRNTSPESKFERWGLARRSFEVAGPGGPGSPLSRT